MNWNTKEFIWLDWAVLAIGVVAIIWAIYHAIKKDKEKMKGADSQDYLFGKGEPWYIIGAAIFAANIGSEHLVGLAGTGAKDGVGMAHWEMQGWMILILGWLFVKPNEIQTGALKFFPSRLATFETYSALAAEHVFDDYIVYNAVFGAVFGGRDRLSSRFMDHPGVPVTLALGRE